MTFLLLETNSSKTRALRDGKWQDVKTGQVKVGDIMLIHNEEVFPADIVLLGAPCDVYIMTSSLDGEKNLKKKTLPKGFNHIKNNSPGSILLDGTLEAEHPTQYLTSFKGLLDVNGNQYGLNVNQFMPKGAYLMNTEWMIGIVVYTGKDTKIMRNSSGSRNKQSKIEGKMNSYILWILCVQIFLCLIITIYATVWYAENKDKDLYLALDDHPAYIFMVRMGQYFLLLNTLIPISLMVTLEVVKII